MFGGGGMSGPGGFMRAPMAGGGPVAPAVA